MTINLAPGMYTHDQVQQLIEQIQDRIDNGATLIATKVK
jgi:hypothetical protein